MTNTKKFSEFVDGGDIDNDNTTVGLEGGVNTKFNNPWTFLPSGATGERPAASPEIYYRLRLNTTLQSYEFYDPTLVDWVQLGDSGDIANLIARLAAHTAGDGASMIGLEDQGTVSNKTVQDLAESSFVTVNDDTATLLNSQQLSALALLLSGGTMAGDIDMNGNRIDGLPIPLTGNESATKGYVDGIAFNTHPACDYATTTNLAGYTYDNGTSGVGATLTAGSNGAFSTDGQSPALNDRILVPFQTNEAHNGIYTLTQVGDGSNPAILTRADDYDESGDMQAGDEVAVVAGDTLAGSKWMMTQTSTIVVGTTNITWVGISIPLNVVTIDGTQTIAGNKEFTGVIEVPNPSTSTEATNKDYVDTNDKQEQFVYTSGGSPYTWTKPAEFNSDSFIEVWVLGGGGGSGGTAATGVGQFVSASGGNGGGYAYKKIPNASLGSTETVTVGAGGAGGAAGNNNGSRGNTSSFGSLCTATGGGGGNGSPASAGTLTVAASGTLGSGTGGDINTDGGRSTAGQADFGVPILILSVGAGSAMATTKGSGGSGAPGSYPAGGGVPPGAGTSQAARAGSAGAAGVVIVKEHY
jgi:hypothetical protein